MIMEPWKAYLIWHTARNNSCRTHSLSIVGNIPKGLTECILDLPRILIALSIAMGDRRMETSLCQVIHLQDFVACYYCASGRS